MDQINILLVLEDTRHEFIFIDVKKSTSEIFKHFDLDKDMYELYHNGIVLNNDLLIRETELTDNCRVDILMKEVYKSFLKDKISGIFDDEYDEYHDFYIHRQRIEELSISIEQGPIGEYLNDPRSVFKLKTLIYFTEIYSKNPKSYFLEENIFRFIDETFARKCNESGYSSNEDYLTTNPDEYLFDFERIADIESKQPMMSLDVFLKLGEIEKFDWIKIGSFGYLDLFTGPEFSLFGCYNNGGNLLAFVQYNHIYIVVVSGENDSMLYHNNYHFWDEGRFENGYNDYPYETDVSGAIELMKNVCRPFFSYDDNPLFDALNEGDLEKAKTFLPEFVDSENRMGIPASLIAARIGWIDAVKLLLEHTNIDINKMYDDAETLMTCAIRSKNCKLIEYLNSIGVITYPYMLDYAD